MIYIGFTTGGGPPTWNLFFSALSLRVPGEKWRFIRGDPSATDWARNDLVRQFLDNDDAEWLLQVDRDAILHPDTVPRLLSWDKRVVAALSFCRGTPVLPAVWTQEKEDHEGFFLVDVQNTLEWIKEHQIRTNREYLIEPKPDDALIEVKRTGAHCLLAHRSVYEELDPPWFKFRKNREFGNRGEDFHFCKKLQKAEIPIYVDRSVLTGHSGGERSMGALDFVGYTHLVKGFRQAQNR